MSHGDLIPDDFDEMAPAHEAPKNKDKTDLKQALKAMAKKDGKARRVVRSEAWTMCCATFPGVFEVEEFHSVCDEVQADWDAKRAAKGGGVV